MTPKAEIVASSQIKYILQVQNRQFFIALIQWLDEWLKINNLIRENSILKNEVSELKWAMDVFSN